MTDEQWLWLFVNQLIDSEEHLEKMCPECKDEAISGKRCIRCGKVLTDDNDRFINPNFDRSKFEELSNGEDRYEDNIDIDLIKQISEDGGDIG